MEGVETMKELKITDKKELVKLVSFMVMGDGGVYSSGKHCMFSMNMQTKNRDFIDFCCSVMSNITTSKTRDYVGGCEGKSLLTSLTTFSHPFFTKIRDRVYTMKYKGVDPHALKLLDAQALSILYQCDGSYSKDKRTLSPEAGRKVTLNLKRLSYGDQHILKNAIKLKLNIVFNIHRQNQYYYLSLRSSDVDKFFELVAPYMFDSFLYKLSDGWLQKILDGEIVRSV